MNQSFREAWALLPDYLSQHVILSVSALILGVAISVPLGIVAARSKRIGAPILGLVSVIQTIPGLALLALFYPLLLALSSLTRDLFGVSFRALGFLPALLALTLYAMLPILRNLVTALNSLDPAILMAAKGVGMTPRQSLYKVELPLAAPQLLAGIRTATVWVVGITTLSTPIGQTSLGNYIFTGLQTENWIFVLFGCVAAAALAMVLDFLLAVAGAAVSAGSRPRLALAGMGLVVLIAAALVPGLIHPSARGVVIGAKNFDEQYILADAMTDRLRQAGFAVSQKIDLGSTVALRALAASDIDAYVDYSGTLWGDAMHRTDMPGRQAMLDQLKSWLAQAYGVALVGSLGFENAYVFAMRTDRAKALHIHSLADVAAHPELTIGGDFEIFSRPEWRRVAAAYGLSTMRRRQYQPDFLYRAVMSGDADLVSAFSSDGRIARYGLTILDDPKNALPPYDAVLLVGPAHAHDARFMKSLAPLIGAIPLPLMQQANLMVDRDQDKRTPAETATWLEAHMTQDH
ncbi:MAG TPA: ABC transporter permease/substrate-binding protein [Rhizomicrobium sp.]|jgi:osmoprotectant transport system permease protein|nr:ABC transporter permease/substrate-binding protein [Rhizomicrobium sp.]